MNSRLMNIHIFCCLIKIQGREGEEGIMTASAAEQNRSKTQGRCHCRDNRNLPPAFWGDLEWRDVGSCQKIQSTNTFSHPFVLNWCTLKMWRYLTPLSNVRTHHQRSRTEKKKKKTGKNNPSVLNGDLFLYATLPAFKQYPWKSH